MPIKRILSKQTNVWEYLRTDYTGADRDIMRQMLPWLGKWMKIPLLSENIGKKKCKKPWDRLSGHYQHIENRHKIDLSMTV